MVQDLAEFGIELAGMAGIVHDASNPATSLWQDRFLAIPGLRIAGPRVRQGWLEHGPRAGANKRGGEPFVTVPWDRALDLVAGELRRVKEAHGNAAIYAGSPGWASAAATSLRRLPPWWCTRSTGWSLLQAS